MSSRSRRRLADSALRIISTTEPIYCCYRVFVLTTGAATTPQSPTSMTVVAMLIGLNIVQGFTAWRRGPEGYGRTRLAYDIVHSAAVIPLIAALLPERTYLSATWVLPFAIYAAPAGALVALYPRSPDRSRLFYRLTKSVWAEALYTSTIASTIFFLAVMANGYSASEAPLAVIWVHAGWVIAGVAVGHILWYLCRTFSDAEAEVVRQSHNDMERWLHSELKGDIVVLRRLLGSTNCDDVEIRNHVDSLNSKIQGHGLELLLELDTIPMALIVSRQIRRFRDCFHFLRVPTLGDSTIGSESGRMLNRVLGELLSNAADADCTSVSLDIKHNQHGLSVLLEDDGPGFADAVMEDPATSLSALRQALRIAGGSLTKSRGSLGGTAMVAHIPERR